MDTFCKKYQEIRIAESQYTDYIIKHVNFIICLAGAPFNIIAFVVLAWTNIASLTKIDVLIGPMLRIESLILLTDFQEG